MKKTGDRRHFMKNICIAAGVAIIPSQAQKLVSSPPHVVGFVLHFPRTMTREEFRQQKADFENADKISALKSAFVSSGKIAAEESIFDEQRCLWQVTFASKADFDDWMKLTIELKTHNEALRDQRGFRLEIRNVA